METNETQKTFNHSKASIADKISLIGEAKRTPSGIRQKF